MKRLLIVLFLLLFASHSALAGRAKPKKSYPLEWRESGGAVVLSTVCDRYSTRSLDYRQCRSYALDHFTALCRKHTRAFNQAGGKRRDRERRLKRSYCRAAQRLP